MRLAMLESRWPMPTSAFVESVGRSSHLTVGTFAWNLLQRGTTRGSTIQRRLKHLFASLPSARTTPRVAVTPSAPLWRQQAVDGCPTTDGIDSIVARNIKYNTFWKYNIE